MAGRTENLGGISIRVTADASQIKSMVQKELTGLRNETIKIPISIDDGGKISELRKKLAGLDVPITVKINRDTARSLKRDIQQRLEAEGGVHIPVKVKAFTSGEAQQVRDSIASQLQNIEVSVGVRWHWVDGPPPGGGGPGGGGGVVGGPMMGMPGGGGQWVRRGGGVQAGVVAGSAMGAVAGSMPRSGEPLPGRTEERVEQPAAGPEPVVKGPRKTPRSQFRRREDESEDEHRRRLREMQREREQLVREQGFPTDDRAAYNKSVKAYNDLIYLRKRLGEEGPEARLPRWIEGASPYPQRVDTRGMVVRGPAYDEQRVPSTAEDRKLPKDQRPVRTKQVPIGPLLSELTPAERRAAKIRSGLMGPAEGVEYRTQKRSRAEIQADLRKQFGVEVDTETARVTNIGEEGGQAGLRAKNIERFVERDLDRRVLEEQESHLANLKRQRDEMERGLQHPMRSSRYRGVIAEIGKTEPVVKDLRGRQTPRTQRTQRSFMEPGLEATPEQLQRARQRLGEGASDEEVLAEVENEQREIRRVLVEARQQPHGGWESFTKSMRRDEKGRFRSRADQQSAFLAIADRPLPRPKDDEQANEAQRLGGGAFSEAQRRKEAGDLEGAYNLARDARTALLGAAFAGGVIPGVAQGTAKRYLDPKRLDLPTAGTPEQQRAQIEWAEQMDAFGAIQTEIRRERAAAEAQARRSWGGQAAAETRRGETTGEIPRHPGGQRFSSREMRERNLRQKAPRQLLDPDDPRLAEVGGLMDQRDALLDAAEAEKRRTVPRVDEALVGFLNKAGGPPLPGREPEDLPINMREYTEQGRRNAGRNADREEEPVYLSAAHKRAAEVEAREKAMRERDPRSASAGLGPDDFDEASFDAWLESKNPAYRQGGDVDVVEARPGELDDPRPAPAPTNLERLRNLTQQLSDATSSDEIRDLLEGFELAGAKKAPEGFNAIEGALISIQNAFRPDASEKDQAYGRKRIEELKGKFGASPEEIATSHINQPDVSKIRDLEEAARRADVQARWLYRRQIRAQRGVGEIEPMEMPAPQAMAAGPAMPPGGGPPGDDWEWQPFGGAPGAIHVIVDNWPAWMMGEGGVAAGPLGGLTPGQQEQAIRGTGQQISFEDMAAAVEAEDEAAKAAAEAEKAEKEATKRAELERRAGLQVARPAPESPRALASRLGQFGRDPALAERLSAIADERSSTLDVSPIEERRQQIEQQLAMSRQGLPIRGFATSVAQEVAGGARGATYQRFTEAGRLLKEAVRLEEANARIGTNIKLNTTFMEEMTKKQAEGVKLTAAQEALLVKMPKLIESQGDEMAENVLKQQELLTKADEMAKLTGGERLANLAKSLTGSVGGFLAYSTAIGGVGAALGAAGLALGDWLERQGGYLLATQQITNALSDQTKASGGAVQQTVAQTAAQSNLSEETYRAIAPILEQRAAVEAGNKAYQEQIKLLSASGNVQAGQRGGFDQGLFQTTGGLAGTPLFGTPSTQELIGQRLEKIGELPIREKTDLRTGNVADFDPLEFTEGEIERQKKFDVRAERLGGTLDELNAKFEGSGLELVDALSSTAGDVKESARVLTEGGAGGIADQLAIRGVSLSDESLRMLQAGGPEAVGRALQMFNERDQRPDAGVLLAGLEERVLPAMQFQIRQNLADTLETFLPAQRGLQYLAQPRAPFGRGLVPLGADREFGPGDEAAVTGLNVGGEQRFGGVPQAAIDSFRQYEGEAERAIDAINAKAAEGERVLADKLGVPESSIEQLRAFGKRIGDINQQQADIRLDLQMTQYNRQLFLANRQLGDLAGLTGREGATQIGMMQRQDLMLSRRSQALSLQTQQLGLQTQQLQLQSAELGQQQNLIQLERAQRQVNFQRAVAGFTAPGTTPEERAARIEEAKVEADYAQREIDFQRQQLAIQQQTLKINREQFGLQQQATALAQEQFANQVALQDALNNRAYEDQAAAIAEMQKAFEAQQELQALEDLKGLITEQRDLFLEEMQAQVKAEEDFIRAQAQFSADIMSQTGDFVEDVVGQVGSVFTRVARAFAQSSLGKLIGAEMPAPLPAPAPSSSDAGANPELVKAYNAGPQAAGFSGRISTPTTITLGEAGSEELAILRNPRQVLMGGSGGGGFYAPINITVEGGSRGEAEDEALAARIAARVERELGRRAHQLGFGRSR